IDHPLVHSRRIVGTDLIDHLRGCAVNHSADELAQRVPGLDRRQVRELCGKELSEDANAALELGLVAPANDDIHSGALYRLRWASAALQLNVKSLTALAELVRAQARGGPDIAAARDQPKHPRKAL